MHFSSSFCSFILITHLLLRLTDRITFFESTINKKKFYNSLSLLGFFPAPFPVERYLFPESFLNYVCMQGLVKSCRNESWHHSKSGRPGQLLFHSDFATIGKPTLVGIPAIRENLVVRLALNTFFVNMNRTRQS